MMKKMILVFGLIFFLSVLSAECKPIRVVYKPDKSVVIIVPSPNSKRFGETETEWLERIFNKLMQGDLEGLPYDDMDSSQLPPRAERQSWEGEKGQGVSVNVEKKEKAQHKKLIRKEKGKILKQQAIQSLKDQGKLPQDYSE